MVAPARPGSNYTQPSTITELESCGCRYKTSSFGVLKQPISVNLTTAIVSSGPLCGCGTGALWQLSLIFPTFQQFNGIKLTSHNITALEKLGAKIFVPRRYQMVTSFPHPSEKAHYEVSVYMDPPHMLKLIRNTLADYEKIFWPSRGWVK